VYPHASVLVVEEDATVRTHLLEVLASHGHAVRSVGDGFSAFREVSRAGLDAVVLDLPLPDIDGGDALRMIRGISQVPVLVAMARDEDEEIVNLLNAGADDCLVKPFSGGQLAARLGAVLRRAQLSRSAAVPESAASVAVGDLRIDRLARTASLGERELRLTRREFDLLWFLAQHAGQVVSKRRILTEVWREPYIDDQTIDVHLCALRRKLGERGARPHYLQTVRGVGIKMVTPR
jgi:DNA-binding response OmpR family regulator